MQILSQRRGLKAEDFKGLALFALIATVFLIGKRKRGRASARAPARTSKNPLFAKPRSREMYVKRRIIRSLMPDYHALSWRTCGRTVRPRAQSGMKLLSVPPPVLQPV